VSIFQALTEKSWAVEGVIEDAHDAELRELPKAKLGLRVFLAVATVVFTLTVVTYADRMLVSDWRALPEPLLLWLNTALLIMGSVALQWAGNNAEPGREDRMKLGLLLGGGFAFAFLIGQLMVWRQLADLGYYAATNPANAFFYMLTGLHGVHLLGGLVAWVRTWSKVRRGVALEKVRLSVELCAVYWHFLLVVWLTVFALFLFT
jgi:cytochrome c oxidase subunit 3